MIDVLTSVPLVSVLVPAYNAAATIGETIESVFRQTYVNLELIVVNDGSTDGTANVLASFGDRVRVIHQVNGGLASARNAGCRAARGKFIALLDADDRCVPHRIAVQMEVMRKFSDAALCCSEFSAFDTNGQVAERFGRQYYSMLGDADSGLDSLFAKSERMQTEVGVVTVHIGNAYASLALGNFLHPGTILFSRTTLQRVGEFDETVRIQCDWEWNVRASRTGRVVYVDTPLLEYRLSPTQMSASRRHERAADTYAIAMRIWNADPALASLAVVNRYKHLGTLSLEAADAFIEHNKRTAGKYLRESVFVHGVIDLDTVKIFLKLLLPLSVVRTLRRLRGRDAMAGKLLGKARS